MAFGSLLISNTAPTVLNPFVAAPPSAAASATSAPTAQTTPSPAALSPARSAAAPARPTGGGARGGGGGAAAAVTSSATLLETATAYTTTIAGKQYSGSVVASDGEYTASVPNLPGATATGASAQAAENNLDTRIDELV